MNKALLMIAFVCGTTLFASAQSQNPQTSGTAQQPNAASPTTSETPTAAVPVSTKILPGATVYITPMDGFENYLAAAFRKKSVPLVPVASEEQAAYVLKGTSEEKKPGAAKIIFMGQIHSDNSASVQMVDRKTGVIVFAYAVNKKNTLHGQQTTAEACAKHLKEQIEKKQPVGNWSGHSGDGTCAPLSVERRVRLMGRSARGAALYNSVWLQVSSN